MPPVAGSDAGEVAQLHPPAGMARTGAHGKGIGTVYSLMLDGLGNLYAGISSTSLAGRRPGTLWGSWMTKSTFGAGWAGNLYAGGCFCIARWDGTIWHPLV
jgi:hypothetical protein